jgi:hypothetical protein
MPDIASIGVVLSSIKIATDLAKLVKDSDLSLEKAEVKLRLAELINTLADAKIEIAEIQDLLREKDTLIRQLTQKNDLEASIVYEAPYYWKMIEEGQDGPYCQRCYDDKHKLTRLIEKPNIRGSYHCNVCNTWYGESHVPSL